MAYIFTSERLGFRNWELADVEEMFEINSNPQVMEFFPSVQSRDQTLDFIKRMIRQFDNTGFCYFAVETLLDNEFIGFIGLSEQSFPGDFTPCIDIGWRIKSSEWNKGYATEGAKRCLAYAKDDLKIDEIYSIAPKANEKSEHIMTKIGMKKQYEFEHPLLVNDNRLRTCVLYKVF